MDKYYAGKNILIFGGFGYTGPFFVERLAGFGAKVTIVARNAKQGSGKHGRYPEAYDLAKVVSLDPLADFRPLKDHLDKADIVFNLILVEKNNFAYQQSTVAFNFKLLHYCHENQLNPVLVHFGSRLEYAKGCRLPVGENSELNPDSIYGFCKLMSEMHYQFFNQHFGLRTICLRISNIYGSVKEIPLKKNTVDAIIYSALHGEIKIDHDVGRYKDFIYIDDFIDAVLLSIKNKLCYGKTFNIGGGEKISLKDLAGKINNLFSPKKKIIILDNKNEEDKSFFLDISAIKAANNWAPKVNIDEGLRRLKEGLKVGKNRWH